MDDYSIAEDTYYNSVQFGHMIGENYVLYSKESESQPLMVSIFESKTKAVSTAKSMLEKEFVDICLIDVNKRQILKIGKEVEADVIEKAISDGFLDEPSLSSEEKMQLFLDR